MLSPPLLRSALVLALVLAASSAGASSNYPDAVQAKFGLTHVPACTLCHSDLNGGTGTVVTWFGLSTQDFGLVGGRLDILNTVLGQIEGQDYDSDGDGISDVDELRAGTDLNDGPGQTNGIPRPTRGCALGSASPRAPGGISLLGLLLFARRLGSRDRRRARN